MTRYHGEGGTESRRAVVLRAARLWRQEVEERGNHI